MVWSTLLTSLSWDPRYGPTGRNPENPSELSLLRTEGRWHRTQNLGLTNLSLTRTALEPCCLCLYSLKEKCVFIFILCLPSSGRIGGLGRGLGALWICQEVLYPEKQSLHDWTVTFVLFVCVLWFILFLAKLYFHSTFWSPASPLFLSRFLSLFFSCWVVKERKQLLNSWRRPNKPTMTTTNLQTNKQKLGGGILFRIRPNQLMLMAMEVNEEMANSAAFIQLMLPCNCPNSPLHHLDFYFSYTLWNTLRTYHSRRAWVISKNRSFCDPSSNTGC